MLEPSVENGFAAAHAGLLITSYRRLTGQALAPVELPNEGQCRALYEATFGVVSHTTDDDPVFNYANLTAQRLFEMDWRRFTRLPSRKSAEPVNRAERQRLLDRVGREGFIDSYRGVRISATGQRFMIEEATVWNIVDAEGDCHGQAAVFYKWNRL